MSRAKRCRICVWSGVVLSAVLHAVFAAALLQLAPPDPRADSERAVDLDLAMFVGESALTADAAPDVPMDQPSAAPTPTVSPRAERASPNRPSPPADAAPDDPVEQAPTPKAPTPRVVEPKPTPAAQPPVKALRNSAVAPTKPTSKPQPSAKPKPKTKPPKQAERPAPARSATAPETRPKSSRSKGEPVPDARRGGRSADRDRRPSRSAGVSQAAQASAEQAYLNALQRAISRQQRYPASARRRQQTGVTTLSFVIQANGRIGQIRIAKGSGHQALDQAALDALYRLGRFEPIPSTIGRSTWTLRVPIRFDLQ